MRQIKAIILEPEKDARIEMIDCSLEGLQKLVGGYIEVIYPFDYTESATTMNGMVNESRFPRMAFPQKMQRFGLVNMLFKI